MSSTPRPELNLPDEVKQLYVRRYSEPIKKSPQAAPSGKGGRRRVSLSALSDKQDISALAVRNQLRQVLQTNGFLAAEQAISKQYRRYSCHVDPQIVNNLDVPRHRGSFKERRFSDNAQSELSTSLLSSQQSSAGYGYRSKESKGSALKTEGKNAFLWGHTCRDSLLNFRKHVYEKLSKRNDQSFAWSKGDQGSGSDYYKFPKCEYKLRENGMLASGLAALGKTNHSPDLQRSKTFCAGGFSDINNVIRKSESDERDCPLLMNHGSPNVLAAVPQSSRPSVEIRPQGLNPRVQRTALNQKCLVLVTPPPTSTALRPPSLERNQHTKACSSASATHSESVFKGLGKSPDSLEKTVTNDKRRSSTSSDQGGNNHVSNIDFQMSGNPTLQGTPFSGRPIMFTARTVHFK